MPQHKGSPSTNARTTGQTISLSVEDMYEMYERLLGVTLVLQEILPLDEELSNEILTNVADVTMKLQTELTPHFTQKHRPNWGVEWSSHPAVSAPSH